MRHRAGRAAARRAEPHRNLYITFTKQDRLGVGTGHRGKLAEAPLPVRFDITRVIDAVSSEMTTWARDLVERNGWDVPNPPRRSAHNGAHGVVFYASSPKVDLACYAAEWLADHVGTSEHTRRPWMPIATSLAHRGR